MSKAETLTVADGEERAPVPLYSHYLLVILFLVGLFNFIDRQILLILIEPIRQDLALSDTQIGLLTGFSFAIVYATGGLWLARIADNSSRRKVLGIAVIVWSAMTALGGLAQNFWQLAATRLGVAGGEAGATPSAHGLIATHFPVHRRALAIAIFATATPLGTMLGFAGGGWLAGHFHWRTVLSMVGLPGIALGVVLLLTVKEGRMVVPATDDAARRGVIGRLLSRRSYRQMMAGFTLVAAAGTGFASFQAPFLMRLHGFDAAQAGLAIGLLYGVAGGLGTLGGGIFADHFGRRNARWRLWLASGGLIVSALFMAAALTVADGTRSVLLTIVPTFAAALYLAPTFSVAQSLASPSARSTASALLMFASSLVGVGTGALLIGSVSDLLAPHLGVEALRYALLLTVPLQLLAALHYYVAGRALPGDLAKPPA